MVKFLDKCRVTMAYPNLTIEDIQVMTEFFNFVDQDHDGLLTIEEIKTACQVDINMDGVISEEERAQCARVWTDFVFANQDMNGDNKISLEELLKYNNDTKIQN